MLDWVQSNSSWLLAAGTAGLFATISLAFGAFAVPRFQQALLAIGSILFLISVAAMFVGLTKLDVSSPRFWLFSILFGSAIFGLFRLARSTPLETLSWWDSSPSKSIETVLLGDDDSSVYVDRASANVRFEPASGPLQNLTRQKRAYANVELHRSSGDVVHRKDLISGGEELRLRLSIGEFSKDSLVSEANPFPRELLPENVVLDVMVSSTEFLIGKDLEGEVESNVAHGTFDLREGDEQAITSDGGAELWFLLKAPNVPGTARCRINYYYDSKLVQSQLLKVEILSFGEVTVATDYTLSEDLSALERLPKRRSLSILTNSNGNGTHQVVLREPGVLVDENSSVQGETFLIDDQKVNAIVKKMRAILRVRAPRTEQRTPSQLRQDVIRLAPLGRKLWELIPGQYPRIFQAVMANSRAFIIQVSRPTTSGFVFPWSLIYDIPLGNKPKLCKLVEDWDGKSELTQDATCPYGPHVENVLCPFGFWGFRYSIDQIASSRIPVVDIQPSANWDFIVGTTKQVSNPEMLRTHIDRLQYITQKRFPGASIREGSDKIAIRKLLGQDVPLIYFYCHGMRKRDLDDTDTYLTFGHNESLTANEFRNWLAVWMSEDNKVIWDKVRPLIFINACHSLEVQSETLVSYLDAFVGSACAAGVVGTEVKVHQKLAMRAAERFFELLLEHSFSVDEAIRTIRLEYLRKGNLFGLVYTPYCWSELTISSTGPSSSSIEAI